MAGVLEQRDISNNDVHVQYNLVPNKLVTAASRYKRVLIQLAFVLKILRHSGKLICWITITKFYLIYIDNFIINKQKIPDIFNFY